MMSKTAPPAHKRVFVHGVKGGEGVPGEPVESHGGVLFHSGLNSNLRQKNSHKKCKAKEREGG